jgi:hypothetical protein
MRFIDVLNKPTTLLFILGVLFIINSVLFARYQLSLPSSQNGGVESLEIFKITEASSTETSRAKYQQRVGALQRASVDTLEASNDNLLRYDSLTTTDVADLEHNYLLLAHYSQQAEDLNPPEEYKYQYGYQYGAFSSGITELYNSAWTAYTLAADPISATKEDFWAYQDHLVYAMNLLVQSNRALGQNYKTTEGLDLPTGGTLQQI